MEELTGYTVLATAGRLTLIDTEVLDGYNYWAPEVQISEGYGFRVAEPQIENGNLIFVVHEFMYAVVTSDYVDPEDPEKHYVEEMTTTMWCTDLTDPGGTEIRTDSIEYETVEVDKATGGSAKTAAERNLRLMRGLLESGLI